jgi:hypothetical protein
VGRSSRLDVGAVRPLTRGFSIAPWPARRTRQFLALTRLIALEERLHRSLRIRPPSTATGVRGKGKMPGMMLKTFVHKAASNEALRRTLWVC